MWETLLKRMLNAAKRVVFYDAGISYRPPSAGNWQNWLYYDVGRESPIED